MKTKDYTITLLSSDLKRLLTALLREIGMMDLYTLKRWTQIIERHLDMSPNTLARMLAESERVSLSAHLDLTSPTPTNPLEGDPGEHLRVPPDYDLFIAANDESHKDD